MAKRRGEDSRREEKTEVGMEQQTEAARAVGTQIPKFHTVPAGGPKFSLTKVAWTISSSPVSILDNVLLFPKRRMPATDH